MITVGIIAEYNPFHMGHLRQIEAIRRAFDTDVTVVSLMSGNFVERGEFAILPKEYRARVALSEGSDLVLEYPYPWSGACAEVFASGGVSLLTALGVDYISFGSESGDFSRLEREAERLLSEPFEAALAEAIRLDAKTPYAVKRGEVYVSLFGESLSESANDILATAYLVAMKRQKSPLKPLVIKREGRESATASRAAYRAQNYDELNNIVPQYSYETMKNQQAVSLNRLSDAVLMFLRLASPRDFEDVAELTDDLCYRILSAAKKAATLDELLVAVASKSYTNARIRRVILSMLLGVKKERPAQAPAFTRLLAANEKGRAFLDRHPFAILTRAGDAKRYGDTVEEQVAFADRADTIYRMADKNPEIHKPFIL